jgi:hypothetical protein
VMTEVAVKCECGAWALVAAPLAWLRFTKAFQINGAMFSGIWVLGTRTG